MASPQVRAVRHRNEAADFREVAKDLISESQREKVLGIAQQYEDIATDEDDEAATDSGHRPTETE